MDPNCHFLSFQTIHVWFFSTWGCKIRSNRYQLDLIFIHSNMHMFYIMASNVEEDWLGLHPRAAQIGSSNLPREDLAALTRTRVRTLAQSARWLSFFCQRGITDDSWRSTHCISTTHSERLMLIEIALWLDDGLRVSFWRSVLLRSCAPQQELRNTALGRTPSARISSSVANLSGCWRVSVMGHTMSSSLARSPRASTFPSN